MTFYCYRATNGTGGGGAQAQAQIEDLNNQMMEMKLTVEGLEKERDFYFGEMWWRITVVKLFGEGDK